MIHLCCRLFLDNNQAAIVGSVIAVAVTVIVIIVVCAAVFYFIRVREMRGLEKENSDKKVAISNQVALDSTEQTVTTLVQSYINSYDVIMT